MWPAILIVVYCALIVVASLLGGWLPSLIRLTHTRMQLMMSLVGGLMMGVALLHLLPHAVVETGSLDYAAWSAVLGLLVMFFIIRIFHVHGHEPREEAAEDGRKPTGHVHVQSHDSQTACPADCAHLHGLSWVGLFIGLAVHTLIDGIALAASVAAGSHETTALGLIGVGTFLAVLLHKPLDALSITSVMLAGGWTGRSISVVNATFSLMCPLGALAFYFGVQTLTGETHMVVGCSLAFAAGAFLCISLGDVLPEVQFHRHDRLALSTALLLGVLLAWAIGLVEPEHAHTERVDPTHDGSPHGQQHEHHEH